MTGLVPFTLELSIVIVAHNSREFLEACLNSVRREAAGMDHEIILIDNASRDGTGDYAGAAFPEVQLIRNRDNVGFARAVNQGLRQSQGRFICLLNPDTELQPGALTTLVAEMQRLPGTGALGGRLLNSDRTLQESFGSDIGVWSEIWRKGFLNLWGRYRFAPAGWILKWTHSQKREVGWVAGTCMMLCRQAVLDAGMMDEHFFLYLEDADLSLRIRQLGWRVRYTPEAEVIHHGGISVASNSAQSTLEFRHSQLHYFKKHRGPRWLKIFKTYLLLKLAKDRPVDFETAENAGGNVQ
ncbi:MAG: glycosyltransferase [Nitrospinaceae bacterium]|nr:glycosyltransferase family 2 protein [Nitrospinaceae bacterium]NIR57313.1 glycosyltransferase family 2 protein [Nitrospinaceae bacterium]NIS87765.1 glycosyltransferase family 2 protein [Nitrospinaceae bacterium]NIT84635.1 glycosyltransferase family 2 protein [Nitrospinaceae bacterium]NIU46814.1 glycosyltransferase family 2 protein [Nitrospinaceae bacterium]